MTSETIALALDRLGKRHKQCSNAFSVMVHGKIASTKCGEEGNAQCNVEGEKGDSPREKGIRRE